MDTSKITAITVVCNTYGMFYRMYAMFRKHYPEMQLIVIDNSDKNSECFKGVQRFASPITQVFHQRDNIGHGRGLNFGIAKAHTRYVLIMDTDTQVLKDPLPKMMELMDSETYGVGCITEVGRDGYDYLAFKHHKEPIRYLHPFFALINRDMFHKYQPFVHHGAPWYKAAVQLHDLKQGFRIKHFDGLQAFDHAFDGILIGARTEYVFHDFGGTRRKLRKMGRPEIKPGWEL